MTAYVSKCCGTCGRFTAYGYRGFRGDGRCTIDGSAVFGYSLKCDGLHYEYERRPEFGVFYPTSRKPCEIVVKEKDTFKNPELVNAIK